MADKKEFEMFSSLAQAHLEQLPAKSRLFLYSLLVLTLLFLLWASFATVEQLLRGTGKVVASGQNKVVQNLEGGIVSSILVKEGQRVHKGETILQIRNQQFVSELEKNNLQIYELMAKKRRLQAESSGKTFTYTPTANTLLNGFLQKEYELHRSNRNNQENKKRILQEKLTQRKEEKSELYSRINNLQIKYDLILEEMNAMRPLVQKGLISKMEALKLKREVTTFKDELESAKLRLPILESSIKEARQNLQDLHNEFETKAREEYVKISGELDRLKKSNAAYSDQVSRTKVTAPVGGTVKQLFVNTIGGVIKPGMDLVEIVPDNSELIVEAKIKPADIAFIHPGQKATIKLTAYDFSIYGALKGEVETILPDAITDKKDEVYYLVYIKTDDTAQLQDRKLKIIPGMVANVDIISGERTIMEYLLKPIVKTRYYSFTER